MGKECRVQEPVSWPLVYCNGQPIGPIEDIEHWIIENSWLFNSSIAPQPTDSSLFQSFAPETASTVSSSNKEDERNSNLPDPNTSVFSASIYSDNEWSPCTSVNSDFLNSELSLESIEIPTNAKKEQKKTPEFKSKNLLSHVSTEEKPNAGIYSYACEQASYLVSGVTQYVYQRKPKFELPQENILQAFRVLRQNWYYKWDQRVLVMLETCFIRCDEDLTSIRKIHSYSEVSSVKRLNDNTFLVVYHNNTSDLYFALKSDLILTTFSDQCHICCVD